MLSLLLVVELDVRMVIGLSSWRESEIYRLDV